MGDIDRNTRSNEFQLARRATYLKISLDRLLENLRLLKSLCASHTEIICVVKGNAYGHGSVPVSRCLQDFGYNHFAVATALEGEELRLAGIRGYIQVFGNAHAVDIPTLYDNDLTPTVSDTDFLSAWTKYVRKRIQEEAQTDAGPPRWVVIKVDTGMSRNGCQPGDLSDLVQVCSNNGIPIHSMMTQFATSWDDPHFTRSQMDVFMEAVQPYRSLGIKMHVASSGGIINGIGTDLDFVRPGIAMYGQAQTTEDSIELVEDLGLKPTIEWHAMATLVKDLDKGRLVGYDSAYRCTEAETIAVLPVGYGDGYLRQNYGKGYLTTADGIKCPVIGSISMDAITVKLPEAARESREFCVMSADFNDVNSCYALAKKGDSLQNEILTNLHVRVPRLYELAGKLTAHH